MIVMTDDAMLNFKNLHIAVVPDGNRRYAKKHGRPEWYGHIMGARKLEEFLGWCNSHKDLIKTVSIYALSTENLNRDKKELDKLWGIYKNEFQRILKSRKIKEGKIKVNIVGDSGVWRKDVKQVAKEVMASTRNYTRGVLNILLAYGSQFEILNSVKKIAKKGIKTIPLAEKLFSKFLLIKQPVDLIIRTGGEYRLSNFLLYQSAYSEIYFTRTLWPEFSRKEFERILKWFMRRERRFGY